MKPSHQSSSGAIVVQEQKIRELCKQLLACRSDAETARLGRALRAALHEYIEQTRGMVLILPLYGASLRKEDNKLPIN